MNAACLCEASKVPHAMRFERASERAFLGVSALVFAAAAAVTIVGCASMPSMRGMTMPGGWTMSMMWMRMPGQTWPGAAAAFVGMWAAMMIAMMMPSLVPMLRRYRAAVGGAGQVRVDALTMRVGVAYFLAWTALGVVVFPLGVALAMIEMQSPTLARTVPFAAGAVVTIAGALQFSAWKARRLACCRPSSMHAALSADAATAWRHGFGLGVHCITCCAGLTAMLLAAGVMDLRAMAVVTAAITAERLAPRGDHVARWIGALAIAAGLLMIARAFALAG